ncbi:MAG: hypothetical protein HC771_24745 [Synechococcales cyanobacterium CRU_2_2]|nr:hypothetical protein [Synechococcales cyanobacterium CRU_2_2]
MKTSAILPGAIGAALILAASAPLASMYRAVASYPGLLPGTIETSPDTLSEHDLATARAACSLFLPAITRKGSRARRGFTEQGASSSCRRNRPRAQSRAGESLWRRDCFL